MKKIFLSVFVTFGMCTLGQPILASNATENALEEAVSIAPVVMDSASTYSIKVDVENSKRVVTYDEVENMISEKSLTADDVRAIIADVLPGFSGYMQTGYMWNDKNAGNNSTFQMKRMRLILDKKISNFIDFRAQFEVFSGSTDSNYKKKVMTIMDAYVNTHFNKALNFRIGQFCLPLGVENFDLSPKTLETIDFSSVTNLVICRNAVATPNLIDYGRDIGVMAYGDLFEKADKKSTYVTYQASISNGYLPTLTDDNKSKDLIGRLVFRPINKLSITGAYNWGEYRRLGEDQVVIDKYQTMHRILTGIWYNDPNGLDLRSEWGHVESHKANVREDAVYVLAGYHINKFLPIVRWDHFRDQRHEYSANNKDAFLAGLTYQLDKNFKIQTAYIYSLYTDKVKDKTFGSRKNNGNGFQIMCLASF